MLKWQTREVTRVESQRRFNKGAIAAQVPWSSQDLISTPCQCLVYEHINKLPQHWAFPGTSLKGSRLAYAAQGGQLGSLSEILCCRLSQSEHFVGLSIASHFSRGGLFCSMWHPDTSAHSWKPSPWLVGALFTGESFILGTFDLERFLKTLSS